MKVLDFCMILETFVMSLSKKFLIFEKINEKYLNGYSLWEEILIFRN